MTIAFIQWQTAAMLWALAGVVLPILAHLLSRRGSQRIALPTARFLALAQSQRGRRLRLSQWLLLLLRIATVALIAIAFARPGWRQGAPQREADGAEELVIVLDASASMGRSIDGATPVARAVSRATQILGSLDPNRDRVGLVVAGVTSEPVLPRLTGNFPALRDALEAVGPTGGSADLAEALRLADRLPGARTSGSVGPPRRARRILLLTDAQAGHFEDLQGLASESMVGELTIESMIDGEEAGNLAITSLSVSPARPTRGNSFVLNATVANHGPRAATIEVRCEIDPVPSTAVPPALVTVLPASIATVSFTREVSEPGAVGFRVSIPADVLDADNSMSATVEVRQSSRVLIVSASPQPRDTAWYLAAALHPDEQSPYDVRRVDASQTRPDAIVWHELDAVILCEAGRLSVDWLTAIDRLVREGGALWWLVDSTEAAAATDVFASIESDAPGLPLVVRTVLSEPETATWSSADALHEALVSFDGPALSALLGVRHNRWTEAAAAPGAAVLIRDQAGLPIVAAAPLGRGRSLMLNGSLARDSSELTRLPLFPALVHEWMAWLGGSERPFTVLHPGRTALIELPASAGTSPAVRIEPPAPHSVVADGARRVVHLGALTSVGEVRVLDAATGRWVAGASVTIHPRESDLRRADAATLAGLERKPRPGGNNSQQPAAEFDALARAGRLTEFWPWLLLAAGLCAIAEGIVTMSAARRESRA